MTELFSKIRAEVISKKVYGQTNRRMKSLVLVCIVFLVCSNVKGEENIKDIRSQSSAVCTQSQMGAWVAMVLGWSTYAATRVIATAKRDGNNWKLEQGNPESLCGSSESALRFEMPQAVAVFRKASLGHNKATEYHYENTYSYHGSWPEIELAKKEPLETIVLAEVDNKPWRLINFPSRQAKEERKAIDRILLDRLAEAAKATKYEIYDGGEGSLGLRYINFKPQGSSEWHPVSKEGKGGVVVLRGTGTFEITSDNEEEKSPPFQKSRHEFIAIAFINSRGGEVQKDIQVTECTNPQQLLGIFTNGEIYWTLVGDAWDGKLILLDREFNVLGVQSYSFY